LPGVSDGGEKQDLASLNAGLLPKGEEPMATIVEATYDGTVFRPAEPVSLEPNTLVRLTVEKLPPKSTNVASFLETARSLHLEGPPDWSVNLDKYLYGEGLQGGS
jgi:hypothetical protein